MRRYLQALAWIVAGGLLLVAAVNAVVDPYGIVGTTPIRGLTAEKPSWGRGGARLAKSLALARQAYEVIILGTSRAEVGIAPDSPVLGGKSAFNAALPGTNMVEIGQVADFVVRHQHPEMVVMDVDLLAFSTRRPSSSDFDVSLFVDKPALARAYDYLVRLLSYQTLEDSFDTLEFNLKGRKSRARPNGFLDQDLRTKRVTHRRLFDEVLSGNFLVLPESYAGFEYGQDHVVAFERAIDQLAAHGVRVLLFIAPVHARQLEAMRVMGLFEVFERWKRDLTRIVFEVNARRRTNPIRLWDFSGYNSITTEDVPARGDDRRMRWYWESSHFVRPAGDLVLKRMLGRDGVPEDFGVELTPESVDAVLAAFRSGREGYRLAHAGEVAAVEDLWRRTEGTRQRLNRR